MILDKGVCTVFRKLDISMSGQMPHFTYAKIYQSWYGELSFESRPFFQTEGRKELRTDARIRVWENRGLREEDVVVLCAVHDISQIPEGTPVYAITRAYHGSDPDSPDPYTDLSLEVTRI